MEIEKEVVPIHYVLLVERVRKLNPEAAEYMLGEDIKNHAFHYGTSVNNTFHWASSPQGRDFWENLHLKLGGDQW